jgi:hypothetical protein
VIAATRAGDSVRITGVRQLEGHVVRAVPETLYVRVAEARRTRGSQGRVPKDVDVAVTKAPDVTISEHVVSKTKTVVLILGAIGLAWTGLFAAYVCSESTSC